ncbi:RNA-guided endonuclease InsQ/TnpB family protein [Streptomyces syringium]|uniref:RNA-guided endonuclease InsQ/TnpB family protein n=1 Tax=Streptomyces syringium TaxID=76729 RepID=UPI0034514B4B
MARTTEVLRAFRFALDPTTTQAGALNQHAGAARWAYNHAIGVKSAAHQNRRAEIAALVETGMPEDKARKAASTRIPQKPEIQKALNAIKGDPRKHEVPPGTLGPHRPCPWWREVSTYAFQSAFIDADRAFQNWVDSLRGQRAGRRVGYPRFKRKGRARDAFRLHHTVGKPTIRLDGYRRLLLPRIGSVRLHDSGKRLARLIGRGQAVIQSVTIARGGSRWYASVLCKVQQEVPEQPTRAQRARGAVGVDLGVKVLAALSKPLAWGGADLQLVPNAKHGEAAQRRLTRAQRAYARTTKGSKRRAKAARRIGRIQHLTAERRATALHTLTKRLATTFSTVAVEDLNVKGMTASARGTVERPGRMVRQKAGLNRGVLDASFGEVRRQLTYKALWYGAEIAVCGRWVPSSQTCSACGWQNPRRLTLADRVFQCTPCGLTMDRDLSAAYNIERLAQPVASGRGETLNARGGGVSPTARQGGRQSPAKREDPAPAGPPRRGNPPATLNTRKRRAA